MSNENPKQKQELGGSPIPAAADRAQVITLLETNAERARRIYGGLRGRLPIAESAADKTARVQAEDELEAIFRSVRDAAAVLAAPSTDLPDLVAHLTRQRAFSERTFGPGRRTAGVVDHIRKELKEIEAQPDDLSEWIDVIILGFDGAWRSGHTPEEIAAALVAKQTRNEGRSWPDWRSADPNKAIEHNRQVSGTPEGLCTKCSTDYCQEHMPAALREAAGVPSSGPRCSVCDRLMQKVAYVCRDCGTEVREAAGVGRPSGGERPVDHRVPEVGRNTLHGAFVSGAKWWEFTSTGGTMWASDRDRAWAEAEKRYGALPAPPAAPSTED